MPHIVIPLAVMFAAKSALYAPFTASRLGSYGVGRPQLPWVIFNFDVYLPNLILGDDPTGDQTADGCVMKPIKALVVA